MSESEIPKMRTHERREYLEELVGQQGFMEDQGIHYPVKILDSRWAFGRFDVEITPLFGKGRRWTQLEKVELGRVL